MHVQGAAQKGVCWTVSWVNLVEYDTTEGVGRPPVVCGSRRKCKKNTIYRGIHDKRCTSITHTWYRCKSQCTSVKITCWSVTLRLDFILGKDWK